jgi:nuclear pore complex protein Nup85
MIDPDILFTSNDSFELLRVLDEVTQNSSYAPEEYLDSLIIYLQRSEASTATATGQAVEKVTKMGLPEANRKLDQVRLALARNLARALVVGFENPF